VPVTPCELPTNKTPHPNSPPPLPSEGVKKLEICHPERSEGSLQFFVSGWNKSNCGDPSLRSG
jgi:hypothetical protein